MTNHLEPASADPTQRPARLALYVGFICVLLGFIALFLGYQGAATNPIVEAQIPFVISGGLAGLGFLLLGGIGIAAGVVLRVTGEIRTELHQTREAITRGSSAMSQVPLAKLEAAAPVTTNGAVVVSPSGSSYHLPTCRLVERVDSVSKVAVAEATSQGFQPCRVCNP